MSLQRARWRPSMPFLYPQRIARPARSIHLQPTNRNHAKVFKSMAVQMQKATSKQKDDLKNDMGLLSGHFVRPTGTRKPSPIRDWKRWKRLQWLWFKSKYVSVLSQFSYKFFLKKSKPRPTLDRRKIGPLAQTMYEEMYTAFARGDFQSIKEVCLDSLQGSLRSKIGNRHPKERVNWTLHRYIGRPRIVSTRIGKLPFDESAIYQVVVKVKSMQSLEKMIREPGKKSDVVSDEEKGVPKRVTEYVVLQKSLLRGNEVPWKIWGMTEENKSEDVLREGSPSNLATAV